MKNLRTLAVITIFLLSLVAAVQGGILLNNVTFREQFRVDTYHANIVRPQHDQLCPGDSLVFDINIELKVPGPVTITDAWCRQADSTCVLKYSASYNGIVLQPQPERPFTMTRTVPDLAPGAWYYVRASVYNHDGYDMFGVPFTVPENCSP